MRTPLPEHLALALLAGAWVLACAGETTGGGTGGARTTGTGDAGRVACVSLNDCREAASECRRRTCTAGRCGIEEVPEGTPTTDQTAGDCMRSVCDGMGNAVLVVDDTDVPGDHAECVAGTCTAGKPSSTPSMPGTACAMNGGAVCDGMGDCVACIEATGCDGGPCVDNRCVAPDGGS
jgi:hypothetical protein